jgi:hypothetical protein
MLALFKSKPDADAAHLLADHLEAVLGLADELKALSYTPYATTAAASSELILDDLARLSAFVERMRAIELAMAAKLTHARRSADRLAKGDDRIRSFAALFHSGTASLADALPRLSDASERAFNHGDEPIGFLKRRAMLPAERVSLEGITSLKPDDGYLLLSVVTLGALVELSEACLTALDTHYGIYEAEDDGAPSSAAGPEAPPQRLTDRLKRMMTG